MQKGPHQWAYKVAMKNGWQHVLPAPLWVKPKTVVAQPVPEGFFI
jgi:nitrogen fixation protein